MLITRRTKFFAYLLLISLFSFAVVSAALGVTITPNNPSILLNHGQSQPYSFRVSNDNDFCDLTCDWTIIQNEEKVVSQGTKLATHSISFDIPYTFRAPTKSESRLTESGSDSYVIAVECKEVPYLLICGSDDDPATSTLTLNYELTSAEKDAKSYLQPQLERISNLLRDSESKLYNINSKLAALPKNVLIADIKSKVDSYSSEYTSQKSRYDSVNNLYNNLEFLDSRSSFDVNQEPSLTDLSSSLNSVYSEIDERLRVHNEVVEEINSLNKLFSELEKKSSLINLDVSQIRSQLSNLKGYFESGQFSSYDTVKSDLNTLTGHINAQLGSIDKNFAEILSKGISFLSKEKAKINLIEGVETSDSDLDGLSKICSGFSQVKKSMESKNNNLSLEYNLELQRVREYNSKFSEINKEIIKLNDVRQRVSDKINKNGIRELDFAPCQSKIQEISQMDYTSLIVLNQSTYDVCIKLDAELSKIKIEKERDTFFEVISFLRGLWPFGKIKFAEIKELKERNNPGEPNLLSFDTEAEEFSNKYCNIDLSIKAESISSVENLEGKSLTESDVSGVKQNENMCSSFGITAKCCEGTECADDVSSYPVIFLHGHSFKDWDSPEYSLDAFNNMQLALYSDKYRIGGVFLPNDRYTGMTYGEWGKLKGIPITVKATYYYGVYNSEGKFVNAPSNQESISTYAQRLKDIVELVKYRTGRDKVIIISHSMGGLVSREYIKNYGGDSSVYKLIMIGTPNHGIYNGINLGCSITGADTECAQMEHNSPFLNSLNSGDETYGNVKYYTIAGSGCIIDGIDGDTISRVLSVQLNGAKNVKVDLIGSCSGLFKVGNFHSDLLNPDKYPKTLEYIKQFLKE